MSKKYCSTFLGRPLELTVDRVGDALAVRCNGGDIPHIGSVSLAQPYVVGARRSASVSGASVVGHKDSELGNRMANYIAKETGQVVAVVCGIHYHNLAADHLNALVEHVMDLCRNVVKDMTV